MRQESCERRNHPRETRDSLAIFGPETRAGAGGRKTADKQSDDFRMGAFHPKN